VHAQLAQSIADSQKPATDGRMARPAAGQSDAVTSFGDLVRPTDIADRLGVCYGRQVAGRQMALTGTALFQRGVESSRPGDRTDREVAQQRAEPDKDGTNARSDEIWNTQNANSPSNFIGSERELVAADPPTEATADNPEIDSTCDSHDEADPASPDLTGVPTVPLTIPTVPSGTRLASDWGLESDASAAGTRAVLDPVVPILPDVADALGEAGSADSAPIRGSVQTASEGLSSKPSSLLVPQAVVAAAPEMAATPGVSNTPSAAPIAGVTGPELAGAARQSPSPPPGTAQPSQSSVASPAQAPADPAAPPPVAIAGVPGTGDAGDGDLANAEQGFSSGAGTHAPLAARATGADRPLAIKPVAAQVALHVGKAAKAGLTRIEIALDPASLGRVEVRLDFGRDGSISTLFVAETREALDALRADARTLERALSEAGLKADSGSLGFSLREQGAGAGGRFSEAFARTNNPSGIPAETALDAGLASAAESPTPLSGERRLDIRA
jgi:flagellar hook-length control protein FliK